MFRSWLVTPLILMFFTPMLWASRSLVCTAELNKGTLLERLGSARINTVLQLNPDKIGVFMNYFSRLIVSSPVKKGFREALRVEDIFTRKDSSGDYYSIPTILFDERK